jgi:hypothetical protein
MEITTLNRRYALFVIFAILTVLRSPFHILCQIQNDVMNFVAKFNFLSVFDAKSGYWQTKIKPDKTWLTGIYTPFGLYEWTRTPFGMRNSGSTFCYAVNEILKSVKDFTANFVDDMCVCSMTWDEHLINLRKYFKFIRRANITSNMQKSELAQTHVKFVGHVVGGGKKHPDPERITVIQKINRPHTLTQLRSVLGVFNYHRPFINHYSSIVKPLTDLTS